MNYIYMLVAGCISFCVGIMLKTRVKIALCGSFVGGLCYFTFISVPYEKPAYFISALLLAVLSEIMAKLVKAPSTLFLIMGVYVLVPGAQIYQTFLNIINGSYNIALNIGATTFVNLSLIAAAIALVSAAFGKTQNI
ncbi:MAG: threonine/serine exporter family protein [Eubacteriales bacterium]|nr:threonine/serine exporter family protein [Eubacteriales bacterium]